MFFRRGLEFTAWTTGEPTNFAVGLSQFGGKNNGMIRPIKKMANIGRNLYSLADQMIPSTMMVGRTDDPLEDG